jgi:hypothetical protein
MEAVKLQINSFRDRVAARLKTVLPEATFDLIAVKSGGQTKRGGPAGLPLCG